MRTRLLVASVILTFACRLSHATPVTYTDQFIASGTFGGASFSAQTVTFVGTGDTDNGQYGTGRHGLDAEVPLTSLSLTVGAITASLDGSLGTYFIGEQGILEIDQITGPTSFAAIVNHPHALDYTVLFTNFSNSTTYVNLSGDGASPTVAFSTDLGPALLAPSYPYEGTFTTTLGATPEPSSIGLFATGLLGIAGLMKGRRVAE